MTNRIREQEYLLRYSEVPPSRPTTADAIPQAVSELCIESKHSSSSETVAVGADRVPMNSIPSFTIRTLK